MTDADLTRRAREYTPTTDEVRRAWTDWHDLTGANSPEEFDRWLAAHDAQERASALADAANDDRWHRAEHRHVRAWLRARAATVADAPAADEGEGCDTCPKTDVCGEDITHHAMLWHIPRKADDE